MQHSPEDGAALLLGARSVPCCLLAGRMRTLDLDPQRQAQPSVDAGGHLRGPLPQPRHRDGLVTRERGSSCRLRCGRSAWQAVRDRVQEGRQQWTGLRNAQRAASGQRHGVGLRRHRGGQLLQRRAVRTGERAQAPGVVAGRRHLRPQSPLGGQPEGEQRGGAPECCGRPRPLLLVRGTGSDEYGQGRRRRKRESRHRTGLRAAVDRNGNCHFEKIGIRAAVGSAGAVRRRIGRGGLLHGTFGEPEGDTGPAWRVGGQEDGHAVAELGHPGGVCQGRCHSADAFLKFD